MFLFFTFHTVEYNKGRDEKLMVHCVIGNPEAAVADPEGVQGVHLNPPPCRKFLNIL